MQASRVRVPATGRRRRAIEAKQPHGKKKWSVLIFVLAAAVYPVGRILELMFGDQSDPLSPRIGNICPGLSRDLVRGVAILEMGEKQTKDSAVGLGTCASVQGRHCNLCFPNGVRSCGCCYYSRDRRLAD